MNERDHVSENVRSVIDAAKEYDNPPYPCDSEQIESRLIGAGRELFRSGLLLNARTKAILEAVEKAIQMNCDEIGEGKPCEQCSERYHGCALRPIRRAAKGES